MRLFALSLILLSLSSLGFAPAPLHRTQREARPSREQLLAECKRKLDQLKVRWRVEARYGRQVVLYGVRHPNGNSAMGGSFEVSRDLLSTLQGVLQAVEAFLNNPDRL